MRLIALLLILSGLIAAGRLNGEDAVPPAQRPNVILVTMDTLRADHLTLHGYPRRTSPELEKFAKEATVYDRAYASAPWTLPSHASMFTGKLPMEHGAHFYKINGKIYTHGLADEFTTIAEVFKKAGYDTGAFVANTGYLPARLHLNQGFDIYYNRRYRASRLNKFVFDWMEERTTRPFFLFINYMDTHESYNTLPRPGFLDELQDTDSSALIAELYPGIMMGARPFPAEKMWTLVDMYDLAIANLDEEIGVLIREIKKIGIYDNTLIILTSDHGEYFGEHTLFIHGKDVYQEVLWVPLMIKNLNQKEGRRVSDQMISTVDLPNMIFSAMPKEIAEGALPNFPNAPGNHPVISEVYYADPADFYREWGTRFDRHRAAIYDWPLKFFLSSDGKNELYDLQSDPTEAVNLADKRPNDAINLRSRLENYIAGLKLAPEQIENPEPITDEDMKELKALGYLGH
ncbi:sulfatase [Candidatus Sumerlaeota bacterium]|nr:sulfatase [Candidatus Sumerlaeota bacterium]